MEQITVGLGERSYPIYIHPGMLAGEHLKAHIHAKRVLIVSNTRVAPLYLEQLKAGLQGLEVDVFLLPDGEEYKNLAHFEQIMSCLLENKHGRDTCLIALGGGVVGDITGFAAACYQRGVDFIQVPTTLLAQVDSSVGGKTAVNHPMGKNMVGAFHQPQAVIIDTLSLDTLPAREFAAGMAEVVKYGIIWDLAFFEWLESEKDKILARDSQTLVTMIRRCCEIKAEVVSQDETEKGVRALLNLGHTFGHAIETHCGYGKWLHGEAVAIGTTIASKLAMQRNWLSATEFRRVVALQEAFGLPTEVPDNMSSDDFLTHMQRDKKVQAGTIRYIIPTALGQAKVVSDVSVEEVVGLIDHK